MTKLCLNKPEGWQSLFDAIDQFDWSDLPSLEEIRAWRTAFRAESDRLRAAGGNDDLDFLLGPERNRDLGIDTQREAL